MVAGPDKDIGLRQAEKTVGHGRHPLDAAQVQDHIRPAKIHGEKDCGRDADTGARRRAGRYVGNPRDLGRGDSHDGGCDMTVAPARYIAAGGRHRDLLLPGDEAGQNLDLAIGDRRALRLGKQSDVAVREPDVSFQLFRHQRRRRGAGFGRHDDVMRPLVQIAGKPDGGGIAIAPDFVQNGLNRSADIALPGLCSTGRFLQIDHGHSKAHIRPFQGTTRRSMTRISMSKE